MDANKYESITVTENATLIVGANSARRNLSIINTSFNTVVYYGPDSSITTSTALPLYENQTRDRDVVPEGYKGAVYGITENGKTADVRYWESSNA